MDWFQYAESSRIPQKEASRKEAQPTLEDKNLKRIKTLEHKVRKLKRDLRREQLLRELNL